MLIYIYNIHRHSYLEYLLKVRYCLLSTNTFESVKAVLIV